MWFLNMVAYKVGMQNCPMAFSEVGIIYGINSLANIWIIAEVLKIYIL